LVWIPLLSVTDFITIATIKNKAKTLNEQN